MGRKVKVKVKTKTKRVKKQPVKPKGGDAGFLSEKIIVTVRKKKKNEKT